MMIVFSIFYWILLILSILLIPFNIPGNVFIVVINFLYMWLESGIINWKLFTILAIIAAISELIEFFVAAKSTQKYGGTRNSMIAAIIGSIFGAIIGSGFFILVGTLMGAMLGAFAGSFIVNYLENKDIDKAMKTGTGSFIGVAGGKFSKIILAVIMLVLIAIM